MVKTLRTVCINTVAAYANFSDYIKSGNSGKLYPHADQKQGINTV